MMKPKYLSYLVFSLLLIFSACEKKEDEKPGAPPNANAGPDVTATINSSVQLSGTASDPDGDAITTAWSVTSAPQGSSSSVNNAGSLTASFTPDVVGNYTLRLTADDNVYDPVFDELIITAEEAVGEPPVAVIRDDENDPISETNENNVATINIAYVLDGSLSSDPDSEDLTFSWEITEKPDGSEATIIPNEDGDMANFMPDDIGEYTVQLTVTDPEGNANSVTVALIATADPVIIDESISVATTWPNVFENPALPDYYVVADISITQELTIAPGVKVMFEPNRGFTVSGNSGALVSIGTADSLIVLTAEDSLNGWDGIIFFNDNAQNEFNYADISYGGQNDFSYGVEAANIGLETAGGFKISNSTVTNSFNYGIFMENGALLRAFGDNTISTNKNNPIALPLNQTGKLDANTTYADNTDNTVEVLGTTLLEDEEVVIPALANGVSYFVSGKLSIRSGFVVSPGTSIEFDTDGTIDVSSDGYFTAEGTAADSIILTGRNQDDGWGGILFFNTNSRNSFSYARLSYGGNRDFSYGVRPANIGVESAGEIKITNSRITNSLGDYGIYIEVNGAIANFSQNAFSNNDGFPIGLPIHTAGVLDAATTFSGNGDNSVEIFTSTLASTIHDPQTLPAFADGTPYYISGRLDIDNELTIKPGATLEFNKDVRVEVSGSDGSLDAVGTADSIITFTARDQSDGWLGIVFFSKTTANKLIYTDISYGGRGSFSYGVDAANVGIEAAGKAAVANSTISNSLGHGIFVENNGELTDGAGTDLTTNQQVIDAGNTFVGNASGETNL